MSKSLLLFFTKLQQKNQNENNNNRYCVSYFFVIYLTASKIKKITAPMHKLEKIKSTHYIKTNTFVLPSESKIFRRTGYFYYLSGI